MPQKAPEGQGGDLKLGFAFVFGVAATSYPKPCGSGQPTPVVSGSHRPEVRHSVVGLKGVSGLAPPGGPPGEPPPGLVQLWGHLPPSARGPSLLPHSQDAAAVCSQLPLATAEKASPRVRIPAAHGPEGESGIICPSHGA